MAEYLSAANRALSLREIAEYHEDTVSSLSFYFNNASSVERFIGYTSAQRLDELGTRIDETSLRSMLIALASIEASFRLDYELRCRRRLKDDLSKALREIYRVRQEHVALDEDIFEAWRTHLPESKALIGELRAAFKLRHWLAHGRYWQPKLGRTFDFDFIYDLAVAVFEEFFQASS